MDHRIRWLGIFFIACFLLLFVQLNNWQVRQGAALPGGTTTTTLPPNFWTAQRGFILTSDDQVMAMSVPAKGNQWQRKYPDGPLYEDVTGYFDPTAFASAYGLDISYNQYLEMHMSQVRTPSNLLTQHMETNDVVTTISSKLQQAAAAALAGQVGAVIALDPQTGAIYAMYANPTYDPNKLSTFNAASAAAYFKQLTTGTAANNGVGPLNNGVTNVLNPPGSTFKIVVSSAIYDHQPALAGKIWPGETGFVIPGTTTVFHNYASEYCPGGPGTLANVFAQSCDTAFARIAMALGAEKMYEEAKSFGFGQSPPIDVPGANASIFPAASQIAGNDAFEAYSAIGQLDDRATLLQMAEAAAAIADNGTIMTPHVLNYVINQQGQLVYRYQDHPWLQATTASTAGNVRQLMLGATHLNIGTLYGTLSTFNFSNGLQVAGKTGTAQVTNSLCGSDAWVTSFAPAGAGQTPDLVVAAEVGAQPGQCQSTGAGQAGPIVRAVYDSYYGIGP